MHNPEKFTHGDFNVIEEKPVDTKQSQPDNNTKQEKSQLAYFHDQKNGGFDTDTGIINNQRMVEFDKKVENEEKERVEKEVGESGELEKRIINTIAALENVKLSSGFEEDKEQKDLLKEKVETAKKLLINTLDSVEEYLDSIDETRKLFLDRGNYDSATFKEVYGVADSNRSRKHNILIDNITLAIRFIKQNFCNMDEDAEEAYYEQEEKAGRKILMVDKIDLPKNIFLPSHVDITRRELIMDWAIAIERELRQIKDNLK